MKRTLVVIFASLALVPFGWAEQQAKKQTKKQAKGKAHAEHAVTNAAPRSGKVHASGQGRGSRQMNAYYKPVHSNARATGNFNRTHVNRSQTNVVKQNNQFNNARNRNVVVNTGGNRRFAVYGNRNYATFGAARQYNWHQRHDRGWWVAQSFPLALYGGGYWYWNNGWWYPAYGYDRYYSNYVYDGPIYGYGNVAPGDVTAEVQRALADQGYYRGPIDGILGRRTRGAIERFQANHGLAVTAAIDQPTLASLGLA